jgi:nucleotide-binding universal stress UspA family protein
MKVLISLDTGSQSGEIVQEQLRGRGRRRRAFSWYMSSILIRIPNCQFRFQKQEIARANSSVPLRNHCVKPDGKWTPKWFSVVRGRSFPRSLRPGKLTSFLSAPVRKVHLCGFYWEVPRAPSFDRRRVPLKLFVRRQTAAAAADGSKFSIAAIRSVAKRPWARDSEFRVIAIPEPFLAVRQFPFELTEVEKLNGDALKDAKRCAAAGAGILARAGLKVETDTPLPTDSDGNEIVKEATRWGANLIVLGSHGRRGFDRLTIGSVSERVAFHAHCSVEVVR